MIGTLRLLIILNYFKYTYLILFLDKHFSSARVMPVRLIIYLCFSRNNFKRSLCFNRDQDFKISLP